MALLPSFAAAQQPALIDQFNTATTTGTEYFGVSFETPNSTGLFNGIAFNFLLDGQPAASGDVYLFTSVYNDTPNDLSTSSFLAEATAGPGNRYVFSSSVGLSPDTTYYIYSDTVMQLDLCQNCGPTDTGYSTTGPGRNFTTLTGVDYQVYDNVILPEPASIGLLLLGVAALIVRRRTA